MGSRQRTVKSRALRTIRRGADRRWRTLSGESMAASRLRLIAKDGAGLTDDPGFATAAGPHARQHQAATRRWAAQLGPALSVVVQGMVSATPTAQMSSEAVPATARRVCGLGLGTTSLLPLLFQR